MEKKKVEESLKVELTRDEVLELRCLIRDKFRDSKFEVEDALSVNRLSSVLVKLYKKEMFSL